MKSRGFLSRLRNFCRNRDGVSAVEFALILPVFATLYFGSIEGILKEYSSPARQVWETAPVASIPGKGRKKNEVQNHEQCAGAAAARTTPKRLYFKTYSSEGWG